MSGDAPLRAALARICEGQELSVEDVTSAVEAIMSGAASPAQIGAFLAALRVKGETVDELVGAARAMRARSEHVVSQRSPLVDTCGTGGDGGGTFSISTAAALVAAGAGAAVAKHGNRAASGRFGGADLLEAFGVVIDLPAADVGRCLDEVGMAFLFARRLQPAMRHTAAVRQELGMRTIFNLLGPLTNPAGATRQVVGVPSRGVLPLIAGALLVLGCEHALVVHSRDGLDEISLAAPNDAIEVHEGTLRHLVIDHASFELDPVPTDAARVADLAESKRVVRELLDGARGPRTDIVVANAAAALYVAGVAATLPSGVARAREAIASGAAAALLDRLIAFTRAAGDAAAGRATV
jgi:anthranilate phosphoribosyltransferase